MMSKYRAVLQRVGLVVVMTGGLAAPAPGASECELLRQLPNAASAGVFTNSGVPDAQGFIGFHAREGR